MRKIKAIEPQQKFNWLLASGIAEAMDVHVTAMCGLPVSHSTCDKKCFGHEQETINESLQFEYIAFRNGKTTRLYDFYRNSKKYISHWVKENKEKQCAIVVDVLSPFLIMGGFSIAKKYHVPVVGIVTDLPELATNMKQRKDNLLKSLGLALIQKLNTDTLRNYDGFVSLTQSINEVVNPEGMKPETVVEGSVDSKIEYKEKQRNNTPVVVYAGGVYAKYGVKTLVEAFTNIKHSAELHIYGDGSYVEELKTISREHPNVCYKGMASLEEIVEIESKATLLVNPRPSNEEFSKYSFPSKTLEYMASGTPLLSTKLSGIPSDYFNYIYAIEDETVVGIKSALDEVLSQSEEERFSRGKAAFDFVKREKTNVQQGQRIVKFIRENFYA